jgi:O-antigen ligase
MNADPTTVAGAVGALGTAVLVAGPGRASRFAGLTASAGGCAGLAVALAPAGHAALYAAVGAAGLGAAALLAFAFVRVPWLLAIVFLAAVPVRLHVSVGSASGRMLVPLYVVVGGAALAVGWQLFGGRDPRVRELGPFSWPLAFVVAWSGIALAWSGEPRLGALYLVLFMLPFALLAVSLARLPWAPGWIGVLYVQLAAMAVAFAGAGIWQYATRDTYLRPRVVAAAATAPTGWFYRVGPVFDDPSGYARFLVVAILAGLVLVLYAKSGAAWAAAGAIAVTWVGLVPSFSGAALLALAVGGLCAVVVLWRRRALLPVAAAAGAIAAVALAVPQVHDRLAGDSGLSRAVDARTRLVSNGVVKALDHPLFGVGTGGFRETDASAAHDTATTVAVETGLPGLAALAWLLVAALWLAFRRNHVRTAGGRVRLGLGLALAATVVESLADDALFQEPLFWGVLALTAVAARAAVPE